ncbi:jg2770 [Pararge aegeria aegeria]|uniref:Jg2770 protein n=1 Tax=Pararge aegeria aegeria TaxID=348720 RepID=A0A8S4QRN6_9NEOP|nr:jg2770 [Pararge aegeria aegeria]
MNPYKDVEESFKASPRLAYEDIATKLLKDNFFLTALELHTELVENGKELPQLREFFSNPGNFEQHVTRTSDFNSMHRTPSQATLDSLDTARYSEDGGGDRAGSGGDIAVLEFELRKARETINALRANLTQFADGDSALDKNSKSNFNQRSLKPHEKRALNFLINEYLLLQNYKLTSITFSDENPDQEFEDWDDVGLNMPRPDNLISLFWGSTTNLNVSKVDASTGMEMHTANMKCQTDIDDNNVCLLIQAEEIELLKQKIIALETEKLNFQKLYDAALVSLNSLTSPTSESKGLELQISSEKILSTQSRLEQANEIKPLTCTASENHYGSGNSTHSATPEQFEMIYSDKTSSGIRSEAAALLAAAAALLPPGDTRRPRLLHSLLTLYKKPEPPDAKAICEATCLVVKWGGSGEVLSSIAELLASRSSERRVLASQVCLSIAPYVPIELCTSLLLSLVVLMCESSEPEIRSIGLKSACLICPVAEHKYAQLENIMFNFLKDPVEKNVKDTVCVFVPVLARSALIAGKFSSELHSKIMKNIIKACADAEWKTVILYLEVMRALVLPELAYVINVQIVKDANLDNCDMETINLQEVPLSEKFIDLQCYITDDLDAKVLLGSMNSLLKEKQQVKWTELDWFINIIKQIIDIGITSKALNHHVIYESLITLFNNYVDNFGVEFTSIILRPIFNDIIMELENKLEKLHAVNVDSVVVVGIYLVSILIAIEKSAQRAEFLQKSVREVAITAWGSITRTCVGRSLACEEQCWAPFENILNAGTVSGREGARSAEALALLVLPTVDSHEVSERAVSLLCALCHLSVAGECVGALAPALQLAAHHCAHHPALLPALRKLEEAVQAPSLCQYKPAIEALLHVAGSFTEAPRVPSPRPTTNLQAAQEVGRRVTQIFQQSKNNMNLQSIFKKKP